MKKKPLVKPEIGMGATVHSFSDSHPATIIRISASLNQIVLQEDKSIRTDNNGLSDCQSYDYESDTNGILYFATLRKDGKYRVTGSKRLVSLGIRRKHHDYSF